MSDMLLPPAVDRTAEQQRAALERRYRAVMRQSGFVATDADVDLSGVHPEAMWHAIGRDAVDRDITPEYTQYKSEERSTEG